MTVTYHHPELAAGRWQTFSLLFQLANVGSEVGRALRAKNEGMSYKENLAFDRALELLHLTIADPKHRERLRELCRAREVLCDFFVGENEYQSTPEAIDEYFLEYGIAAQMERRKRPVLS